MTEHSPEATIGTLIQWDTPALRNAPSRLDLGPRNVGCTDGSTQWFAGPLPAISAEIAEEGLGVVGWGTIRRLHLGWGVRVAKGAALRRRECQRRPDAPGTCALRSGQPFETRKSAG
jgi:hypothetical protein